MLGVFWSRELDFKLCKKDIYMEDGLLLSGEGIYIEG